MKTKILRILASMAFFVSTTYANQACGFFLYNSKMPSKVKSLRKF